MRYKLTGMDRVLCTTKEHRHVNTIFIHLSTDPSIASTFLFRRILDRIERCLDEPKSPLRARFDANDDYSYHYDATPSRTLARRIVKRVAQEPTYYILGDRLASSNRSCIICIYGHSVYLGADHVFFDGIGANKLLCTALDNDPNDLSMLQPFRYYPLFTELQIASKAIQMLNHFPKQHFSYDVSRDVHRQPHFHAHYVAKHTAFVRMKRALEAHNDGKCGYATAIVSLVALFLLAHSEMGEVSIGLATAFLQGDAERFNNVSMVFLCIHRPSNWHQTDDHVRIQQVSRQVKYALEVYGKEQALAAYLLTNYTGGLLSSFLKPNVDCVVGCGTLRFPLICNGKPATVERVEMFGTFVPVYVAAYTCNERVHFDIYSRTFDLMVDDSTPFILTRLMRHLPSSG
jgi:hypothetical protein